MKRILFLIILLLNFTSVFADEPPSWEPYKKVSKNLNFFAWVDYADNDTIKNPWERKWQLSVFKRDSTLLWKRDFRPSGYDDGILTDNGRNFVIIEFWYYPKSDVVSIYNKNSDDYSIKGEEFKIPELFLTQSVSHKLWIDNYKVNENQIFIETLDKSKWKIDIENKKLEKESSIHFYLVIASFFLILILLTFILIKRRK